MRALHHVIIGNSAAAIGAVESIRAHSPRDQITVISEEGEHCYSRPLISELLAGHVTLERMRYRGPAFYEERGVKAILGRRVVALDRDVKAVTLDDGGYVPYDRLLLATGSEPVIPSIDGLEGPGVHTFNSLADALALAKAAAGARRAVVVGGGLIGMKAAEALHHLGLRVTVVELAARILSSAFDQAAGRIMAERAAVAGVEIVTDNAAAAVQRRLGQVTGLALVDGSELPADLLVLAVGVRPRAGLAREAGLEVDRGILVDERMATSDGSIFAAGDVAQGPEMITGTRRVLPLWPIAHRQGRAAGMAMVGEPSGYAGGVSMNSITLFGLPAMSAGLLAPEPGDLELLAAGPDAGHYRKVIMREDRLVGALAVGQVDRFGILTGLLVDGRPCGFLRDRFSEPLTVLGLPPQARAERLRV